jgi:hypothetical protein
LAAGVNLLGWFFFFLAVFFSDDSLEVRLDLLPTTHFPWGILNPAAQIRDALNWATKWELLQSMKKL